MSFKDLSIKKMYRTKKCNIVNEFFIPVLDNAISYKRAAGFFSSEGLYQLAEGIIGLVNNTGRIQLIVSPRLTKEDIEAINDGYSRREIIENRLINDFIEPTNRRNENHLNLLANLIADRYLDIKVAFMKEDELYHEKIGIVQDLYGNKLAFSGSINETYNALCKNFESFVVFDNWSNEENIERTEMLEKSFDDLWADKDDCVDIIPFPRILYDKIAEYKKYPTDKVIDIENTYKKEEKDSTFFVAPENVNFYDYQEEAVANWMDNGSVGIFDMATGSGKTYTALYGLSELSAKLENRLAVVIVAPYQHLVEQWVEDINNFGVYPIVAYSAYKDWNSKLKNAVIGYNLKVRRNFCVITTNSTFCSDKFQNTISRVKRNLCLVADEAHNLGAEKISSKLLQNAKYRLALSATIERYRDEAGTKRLKDYFGKVCQSFTLKDAIKRGFLSKYYYYPIVVNLTEDELEKYGELSEKISNICKNSSEEDLKDNKALEVLMIKRARIVAGAKNKVKALMDAIEKYKNDNHILVYCGATKYDNEDISDDSEVKQITKVTKLLYDNFGFKVRKFTSEENKQERQKIKEMFVDGDDLQIITAIKCLDEGVNIPSIKTAFIMASSTNPKEYIQRRGRVLRKSPDKEYSEIYDFITLPKAMGEDCFAIKNYEISLVKKEVERMMDFAETAENPIVADNLKDELYSDYGIYNEGEIYGY